MMRYLISPRSRILILLKIKYTSIKSPPPLPNLFDYAEKFI